MRDTLTVGLVLLLLLVIVWRAAVVRLTAYMGVRQYGVPRYSRKPLGSVADTLRLSVDSLMEAPTPENVDRFVYGWATYCDQLERAVISARRNGGRPLGLTESSAGSDPGAPPEEVAP